MLTDLNIKDETCAGYSDGTIAFQMSGGWEDSEYSYFIEHIEVDQPRARNLTAGSYSIRAISDYGCEIDTVVMVQEGKLTFDYIENMPTCYDYSDGAILFQASIPGEYDYSVDGGVSWIEKPLFNGLSSDQYQLVIRETNNQVCTSEINELILNQPEEVQFSVNALSDDYCNLDLGSAAISNVNQPSYTVRWKDDKGNLADPSTLKAGEYIIRVTNNIGCFSEKSLRIEDMPAPLAAVVETDSTYCDLNIGRIQANISNMIGDLAYEWYHSSRLIGTTDIIDSLGEGEYQLRVRDAVGCEITTSYTLMEKPTVIGLNILSLEEPECTGVPGELNMEAFGGAAPYSWQLNGINIPSRSAIDTAGIYKVELSDRNGCKSDTALLVNYKDVVTTTAFDITHPRCASSTGSIYYNGEYSETTIWYNEDLQIIGLSDELSNLQAGDYYFSGFSDGCRSYEGPIKLNAADPQDRQFQLQTIQSSVCGLPNGKVELKYASPVGFYQWELFSPDTVATGTDMIIDWLSAGNYVITAFDSSQCVNTFSFRIEDQGLPQIIIDSISPATPIISSGTVFYNTVPPGLPVNVSNADHVLGQSDNGSFSGLTSGVYTVRPELTGCAPLPRLIEVPRAPVLNAVISDLQPALCEVSSTGMAELFVSGGIEPVTVHWSDGREGTTNDQLLPGIHTIIVEDQIGQKDTVRVDIDYENYPDIAYTMSQPTCGAPNSGTITAEINNINYTFYLDSIRIPDFRAQNLAGGEYYAEVIHEKDNSCRISRSIMLDAPLPLNGSIAEKKDPSCYMGSDGFIDVVVEGGTGKISYSWSNGNQTEDLLTAGAGIYTLRFNDTSGCSDSLQVALNNAPLPFYETLKIDDISCHGASDGSLFVSHDGAINSISWEDGTLGPVFTNADQGYHQFEIRYGPSCVWNDSSFIGQPDQLNLSIVDVSDKICFNTEDGIVQVQATGGTGDYTFTSGNISNNTGLFENLNGGFHQIRVNDKNNCFDEDHIEIRQSKPIILSEIELTEPDCWGGSGAIEVEATGGEGALFTSWPDRSFVFNEITAGLHSLIISDTMGCSLDTILHLPQPEAITLADLNIQDPSCFGSDDGYFEIDFNGGTGSLSYHYPDGQYNLTEGKYRYLVKDENHCEYQGEITLSEPPPLIFDALFTDNPTCHQYQDGRIQVFVSGGNDGYNYGLNGQMQVANTFKELGAGSYNLQVADTEGCSIDTLVRLYDPARPVIQGIDAVYRLCEGSSLTLTSPVKNPEWYQEGIVVSNEQVYTLQKQGAYQLAGQDNRGCPVSTDFEIIIHPNTLEADFLHISPIARHDTLMIIDISWPMPEHWTWWFPDEAIEISSGVPFMKNLRFSEAGEYTIALTAEHDGCIDYHASTVWVVEEHTTAFEDIYSHNLQMEVEVGPNPTQDIVYLYIRQPERNRRHQVALYHDASLQPMQVWEIGQTHAPFAIPLTHLPAGVYLIYVSEGTTARVAKVVRK